MVLRPQEEQLMKLSWSRKISGVIAKAEIAHRQSMPSIKHYVVQASRRAKCLDLVIFGVAPQIAFQTRLAHVAFKEFRSFIQ